MFGVVEVIEEINDINKKGYIETTDHRFLIVAKKRKFHENSK
jgi:hypothetical protein